MPESGTKGKRMKLVKKLISFLKPKKNVPAKPAQPVEKPKPQQRRPKQTQQKKKTDSQQNKKTGNQQDSQKSGQKKTQKKKQNKPKPAPKKIVIPEIKEVPAEEGKTRFTELPIRSEILAALQDLEFKYCTPIQEQSLPQSLENRDITGKAQTGTGKTASFLISAINHMLDNPITTHRPPGSARVLILAPTRELAIQIHKDATALCKYTGFNNLAIFGGMGHAGQRDKLNKPIDILVATPGRCIDYLRSNHLKLRQVEILIIDEADRMLDMGFIPDVRRIVQRTPHPGHRHTMMFSATMTDSVLRLIKSWQRNPVTVEIESEELVTDLIDQKFYSVMSRDKLAMLLNILNTEDVTRMIIFINRKDQASKLVRQLTQYNIEAAEMTGDIPQNKRLKLLERLRQGNIKIVVATDVAARGIHVDDISHVVNYDLPVKAEDYVHRIGRTGRAGKTGKAYSFVCESGAYVLEDLEKILEEKISSIWPEDEMLVLPKK